MSKFKLNTEYEFDKETMELLDIPPIETTRDQPEIWKFVILDRHKKYIKDKKYMISTYGRVYNYKTGRLLKPQVSTFFKTKVNGYLYINLEFRDKDHNLIKGKYLIHRLVALTFLPRVKNKDIVNHKDGNPKNCKVWNLEWSTLSENYIHAITEGLKIEPLGENRSNAMWTNDEIHLICRMMAEGHKATFIYNALLEILPGDERVTYERIHTLVKHIKQKTHWTSISDLYDIDTTKFNYSKEQSSVQKARFS